MDGLDWDDPATGKGLIRHFLPPISNDPIPNFLSSPPDLWLAGSWLCIYIRLNRGALKPTLYLFL